MGKPDASQVLVPLDRRAATAGALIRHHAGMGAGERITRRLVSGAARVGLLKPLLRRRVSVDAGTSGQPSLHAEIARLLGQSPLWLSVSFGPPRPNQKPVVRALDARGRTVGVAKIGWDTLTTALVEAEAAAVQMPALRRLTHVTVPELIALDEWRGHRLAVYKAEMGRPGRTNPSWEAFSEVATAWPTARLQVENSPLTRSLADTGALAFEVLEVALARWGGIELQFGGWHGDWTPWNTARRSGGGVVVWDWERAGPGVPLGFDMIHYRFQARATRGGYPVADLLADVRTWDPLARLLTSEEAEATAVWYLMAISHRHAGHRHLTYLEELARVLA
ncbi:MAG TPA: hypothetical protein VJ938_05200 [Acidimicrobiia bacterium]|nr:hypothetical protein [Acidimicrobiia bacterium]